MKRFRATINVVFEAEDIENAMKMLAERLKEGKVEKVEEVVVWEDREVVE